MVWLDVVINVVCEYIKYTFQRYFVASSFNANYNIVYGIIIYPSGICNFTKLQSESSVFEI